MMDDEQLPKGYKNTEVGVIPEDWDVHSLFDEIDTLVAGVSVNSVNEKIDIIHDIAILKTSCVSKGSFYPSEAKKIITSDINRAKHNPKKDHIIISRMNTPDLVGECGYVEADFPNLYLPDRLWMMEFKKASNINSRWLNYILNTYVFRQKIRELGSGTSGSMKNISKSKLLELLIPYPDGAEQTAIATALSDADALINSLEKLIAKKRNIKQGAMQQLLKPKEGWEELSIFQIADCKKELFDDGDWIESEYITDKGIRLIQTGNIGIGTYLEKESKKYINEDSFKKLKCKQLKIGDLLICRLAEPAGRACILPFIGEDKVITSVDVSIYRPNEETVNRQFLNQIFTTNNWFNTISELCGGTTHKRISRGALGRVKIQLPNIQEQARIATILSDMDAEIQALETKLEKYRKIKLGMMQNLLTGKIRLI